MWRWSSPCWRRGPRRTRKSRGCSPTPLYGACYTGHVDVVRALLAAGANWGGEGFTSPLYTACSHGHVDVARALLAAAPGAEVDLGLSALSTACDYGEVQAVRALLSAGVTLACMLDTQDKAPLCRACSSGHVEVVLALLAAGAKVDQQTPGEMSPSMKLAAAATWAWSMLYCQSAHH